MKKIFFIVLSLLTAVAFAMDAPLPPIHAKYLNALMHLKTIKGLYEQCHYQALLEYTRRFIEHPEQDSFVHVIIKRLEESEEESVVKWAWEKKGKSLLETARVIYDESIASSLSIVQNLKNQPYQASTIPFSELYDHSQGIHMRAGLNFQLLEQFHKKIVTQDPEFRFYPDSAP